MKKRSKSINNFLHGLILCALIIVFLSSCDEDSPTTADDGPCITWLSKTGTVVRFYSLSNTIHVIAEFINDGKNGNTEFTAQALVDGTTRHTITEESVSVEAGKCYQVLIDIEGYCTVNTDPVTGSWLNWTLKLSTPEADDTWSQSIFNGYYWPCAHPEIRSIVVTEIE